MAFEAFGPDAVEQAEGVERLFFVRHEDRLIILTGTGETEGVRIEIDVELGMWAGEREEEDWDSIDGYDPKDWLDSASQPDGPGTFVLVDDELKVIQWLPVHGLSAASLRIVVDDLLGDVKRVCYELLREYSKTPSSWGRKAHSRLSQWPARLAIGSGDSNRPIGGSPVRSGAVT